MTADDYPIWISDSIIQALRCSDYFRSDDVPLTRADMATLAYVKEHPGEKTSTIAHAFGIKPSATHVRLGRLVHRGLVVASYESGAGGKIARWRAV